MTFWCVYVSFDRLAFEKVAFELSGLISIFAVWVGSLYDVAYMFAVRYSRITRRKSTNLPVRLGRPSFERYRRKMNKRKQPIRISIRSNSKNPQHRSQHRSRTTSSESHYFHQAYHPHTTASATPDPSHRTPAHPCHASQSHSQRGYLSPPRQLPYHLPRTQSTLPPA
jgi:hypothetical protein